MVVHQRERHPRVVCTAAMDGAPGGENGQGIFWTGVFPAGQEVTGGDHTTVGAAAEPPEDELVEPS
jgi:hypothetical protein